MFTIKLSEKDVPGAKFRSDSIEEHTVFELKRWLQCRGLPMHGNKDDLVKRCLDCVKAKEDQNIIVSIDGGKWYQRKVADVLRQADVDSSKAIPVLPETGWKKFPSRQVPTDFCYGTIYNHIIATANTKDGDFSTSKPMNKGRQYFTSGHVKDIKDNYHKDYYFLKSSVMASFQPSKIRDVTVTLQQSSGQVVDASCDCEASAMNRCNHIAALLFAVENYVMQFGYDQPSCTSTLCRWNKGRKTKRDPKECFASTYAKKMKPDRILQHDHRPTDYIQDEEAFVNNFILTLPNTGTNSMLERVMEVKYHDYEVDTASLQRQTQTAMNALREHVTGDVPMEILGTKDQIDSVRWHLYRYLRITASNAKACCAVTKRGQDSLLKRLLWGNELPRLKSLQYGRNNEQVAYEKFCEQYLSPGQKATKSGFWINPSFPEFGCSPDGLIYNPDKLVSILEIKCPYSLQNMHPLDIENLPKPQKNQLCYKLRNGSMHLRENHAYYFQVQMQMAVCNVNYCNFFVWTPKGCCLQRIDRDITFWNDLKSKLLNFHHNILLPEYFEMRVPRRLMPVNL